MNDLPPVREKPAHNGKAVLIHRLIADQPETLKTDIQFSSVRIVLCGRELYISAIYKPPQVTLTTDDLDLLTESANWQILEGDFNSKHPLCNSHTTKIVGNTLFDHAQYYDYFVCASTTLTQFPTNQYYRPDVFDIALIPVPFFTQIHNLCELSSDHNPTLLKVSSTPLSVSSPRLKPAHKLKKYTKFFSDLPAVSNPRNNDILFIDALIIHFT